MNKDGNKLVERTLTDLVLSASCLVVSRMVCKLSTIVVNLCICQANTPRHNISSAHSKVLPPKNPPANILVCLTCSDSKGVGNSGILLAEEIVRLLPLGAAAAAAAVLACGCLRPRHHKHRRCLGSTVLPLNVLAQHVLLALPVLAVKCWSRRRFHPSHSVTHTRLRNNNKKNEALFKKKKKGGTERHDEKKRKEKKTLLKMMKQHNDGKRKEGRGRYFTGQQHQRQGCSGRWTDPSRRTGPWCGRRCRTRGATQAWSHQTRRRSAACCAR